MYVRRNIKWSIILRFAWTYVILFLVWGSSVWFAHGVLLREGIDISIPFAPLGTIGIAVAFYIGFKNNHSYDRNWEARKIWGGIVNSSRIWANQVLSFVSTRHATQPTGGERLAAQRRTLVYRQLAWINALRFQLRRRQRFGLNPRGSIRKFVKPNDVEELKSLLREFLPEEELSASCSVSNTATQIIRSQGEHLRRLMEEQGLIEDFRHMAMMKVLGECYQLQGKCERIKNTPFPRQYAYFSKVFAYIFIFLLPFGLIGEFAENNKGMEWLSIPFSVLISWIFITMELVGDGSEDPFESFINDVPMTALCRTIEIDLKEMLGEGDIPPPIQPEDDILL